jgi:hypothetical protein
MGTPRVDIGETGATNVLSAILGINLPHVAYRKLEDAVRQGFA